MDIVVFEYIYGPMNTEFMGRGNTVIFVEFGLSKPGISLQEIKHRIIL